MGRKKRKNRKNRKEKKVEMPDQYSPDNAHSHGIHYHGGYQGYPMQQAQAVLPTPQTMEFKSPSAKPVARRPNPNNILRFSPKAWAKFQWFRDRGDTEISGFGISKKEEPLYVVDFLTVLQKASSASIEFDDEALNKFLKHMVEEQEYHPSEVLRIWLHTHPGASASPSGTDMSTFRDVFGGSDWSLMVILAKGGECKAKVRFNVGPACEIELKTQVDLNPPFDGITQDDYEAWEKEYEKNILVRSWGTTGGYSSYEVQGGMYSNGGYSRLSSPQGFQEVETASVHKLSEQWEVPTYGGIYRLKAREADPDWSLVSGTVEQVLQIDNEKDGTSIVITDLGWYAFDMRARISAVPGDDIDSVHDISDEAPKGKGDIAWKFDVIHEVLLPSKITVHGPTGVIDLRDDEDAAFVELNMTKGTDTTQAGFSKEENAGNGNSEVEQSKKKTEVIDTEKVAEVAKAYAQTVTEKKNEQPGFEPGAGNAGTSGP